MEYLAANIIGAIPWIFFFYKRPDLRRAMLIMSILALPIAFFDLLYVPSYWIPKTLFSIPVGIEGFIFSFEVGGFATALFAYFGKQRLLKMKAKFNLLRILPLLIVLPLAYLFNTLFPINITVGMHIGLLFGVISILFLRPDLLKSTLIACFSFMIIYFLCLLIWVNLLPDTVDWFTFNNLPKLFLLNTPVYELTFGFLFGGYWGNLYEVLFGYKFKKN